MKNKNITICCGEQQENKKALMPEYAEQLRDYITGVFYALEDEDLEHITPERMAELSQVWLDSKKIQPLVGENKVYCSEMQIGRQKHELQINVKVQHPDGRMYEFRNTKLI